MKKIIVLCAVVLSGVAAYGAPDCTEEKIKPAIYLSAPNTNISVNQPDLEMDFLHGNVVATMTDNYDITADVVAMGGGYCVVLRRVDAEIGYSDFTIQIDARHMPNSCTYNAVLAHENMHVDAYKQILDEMTGEIKDAVYTAADAIMPVWVADTYAADAVINNFNMQLQSHPDLILIKQKIAAAQEIKNKNIDTGDRGHGIRQCLE